MSPIERRGFIARAGAVGIGIAGFLYPEVTNLSTARATATAAGSGAAVQLTPDPTYAGGLVTSIADDDYVVNSASGARIVVISQTTEVWKGAQGTRSLIEVGDWLDIKGTPEEDGRLTATSGMVFANIARVDGVLINSDNETVTIDAYGAKQEYQLDGALTTVNAADGTPYAGGAAAIPNGNSVGGVGLKLSDGSVRLTKLWVE